MFDALNGLDAKAPDAETQYYLRRTLRNFHLAGVDKDEATRQRIKALRDGVTKGGRSGWVGQGYERRRGVAGARRAFRGSPL